MADGDRIEERLRGALARVPGPSAEATARARREALGMFPAKRRGRRRVVAALLAGAAAAAIASAALAGGGATIIPPGSDHGGGAPQPPATSAVRPPALPGGVRGLAAFDSGRLWLRTRSGLAASGLRATAAELSPNATFVAAGVGDALVVMAPGRRRVWEQPAGGEVVFVSWAPNPILIAYVVWRRDRFQLRMIEGDGDGDRLVADDVLPRRPAWRSDSLALAWATADGVDVLDRVSGRVTRAVTSSGPVSALAYAPSGTALAVLRGGRRTRLLVLRAGSRVVALDVYGAPRQAVAWTGPGRVAVATEDPRGRPGSLLWSVPVAGAAGGTPLSSVTRRRVLTLAPLVDRRPSGALALEWRAGRTTAVPYRVEDGRLRPGAPWVRIPSVTPSVRAVVAAR